jgi:hypothetical protein
MKIFIMFLFFLFTSTARADVVETWVCKESYSSSSSPDVDRIRQLTQACSKMATTGVIGSPVVTGSVSAAETLAR